MSSPWLHAFKMHMCDAFIGSFFEIVSNDKRAVIMFREIFADKYTQENTIRYTFISLIVVRHFFTPSFPEIYL